MNTKPFDLEAALRGEPVWHIDLNSPVTAINRVGNRVAYQIEATGDSVFSCRLDGTHAVLDNSVVLKAVCKTRTFYINLWNSPSNHYTKYDSLEAAKRDTRGLSSESKSSLRHVKLNPEPIEITVEE